LIHSPKPYIAISKPAISILSFVIHYTIIRMP